MTTEVPRDSLLKRYGIKIDHVPRPRAPPRLIRPPSPINMERSEPVVPNVSLILDSVSTSIHSNIEYDMAKCTDASIKDKGLSLNDDSNSEERTPRNFKAYYPTSSHNSSENSRGQEDHYKLRPPHQNTDLICDSEHNTTKGSRGSVNDVDQTAGRGKSAHPKNGNLNSSNTTEEINTSGKFCDSTILTVDLDVLKSDIASILKIVGQQHYNILKLESQVQQLVNFQEKFVLGFQKKTVVCKSTQTNNVIRTSVNVQTIGIGAVDSNLKNKENEQLPPQQKTVSPKDARPVGYKGTQSQKSATPQHMLTQQSGTRSLEAKEKTNAGSSLGDNQTEDFSTILKNLRISDVQGPSMYSQTSVQSLDFPQFDESYQHDDCVGVSAYIGPRASDSVYDSSSDDDAEQAETIQPSETYYNNLFSTVNHVLDRGASNRSSGKKSVGRTAKRISVSQSHRSPNENIKPVDDNNPILKHSSVSSGSSSNNSTLSYSSGSSLDLRKLQNQGLDDKSITRNDDGSSKELPYANNVVDVTKKYLQSLGMQFDSPPPPEGSNDNQLHLPVSSSGVQQQNYMIHQNVYNSIYIPTVNCVPVISDSLNSNSDVINNLGQKYVPQSELNRYEIQTGKRGEHTETTVYGMSANNLSFATKQYLQRYGLVGQGDPPPSNLTIPDSIRSLPTHAPVATSGMPAIMPTFQNKSDRILDITAIKNQPKLM